MYISPGRFVTFVLGGAGTRYQKQGTSIASIPDDSLLKVFSFYVEEVYGAYDPDKFNGAKTLEEWRTLVHVCRRWRNLVFASPRRLNLRLVFTGRTPVMEMLGLWPVLPIVIDDQELGSRSLWLPEDYVDNIVAALELRDRVCQISFVNLLRSRFRVFTTILQESFPALTRLYIDSASASPMLRADSFLGGSAPHLRSLTLASIPFPSLPTLLLTTKDLVELRLWSIPESGYISAAAMVTCLSSLTRLENLEIRFDFPSLPDGSSQRPSSLTLIDLPALTHFEFLGTNEYIEKLVARINAPLLEDVFVAFFGDLFDLSQFNQFIGRAEKFKILRRAVVDFDRSAFPQFSLFEDPVNGSTVQLLVACTPPQRQLLSLEALSSSPSNPLRPSSIERVEIQNGFTTSAYWNADLKKFRWLELLQPFTSAKNLYLGSVMAPHVMRKMRGFTGESTAEVLPALQNIFIQECQRFEALRESIGPFIADRQVFGHPVTVHRWEGIQKDDGAEEDGGGEGDDDEEEDDALEEEDDGGEDDDGEEDDVWEEDNVWEEDVENIIVF